MVSFELVNSNEVLEVVKKAGPVQPLDIRGILKRGDSIVIGAALSELSSRKLVKVTNVKKGGSPFYYVSGQELKLAELSKWLNEKDKQTFEMLRNSKVLKDSDQDPLTRVSLREIKDFAKEFVIEDTSEQVLYWRYYLLSEEEARQLVMGKPNSTEVTKQEQVLRQEQRDQKLVQQKKLAEVKTPESSKEEFKVQNQKITQRLRHEEKQVHLSQETAFLEDDFLEDIDDAFLMRLKKFFYDKQIIVREAKLVRKGFDYEFVILMNTPLGRAEYFCKAKNKKKCGEGDLSSAYLQSQLKRLPLIFITTGQVTKKTKEKVLTYYKGTILKEI